MSRFGRILSLGLLAFSLSAVSVMASGEGEFDAISHTGDGVYIDLSPGPKVELPRIFLIRGADGGYALDFFGSSHSVLESGRYHAVWQEIHENEETHEKEETSHTASSHEEIEALLLSHNHVYADLVPNDGEVVVDFSITRHLIFLLIACFLVCFVFIRMAGMYKRGIGKDSAPRGLFQNMFESLVLFVRDDIARPNMGKNADRYLPYLLSVFFIILFCNLLGLVPFGATATANITVTATLAVFTFVITQLAGTKDYWLHIFWPPGIPVLMKIILVPIEILGLFTKPFALAIRLFANMTAGHLVILNFIGLIFIFNRIFESDIPAYSVSIISVSMSLFIYLIEILVAFIQAYVFTLLSALFIGMAIIEHHHEDHALEAH